MHDDASAAACRRRERVRLNVAALRRRRKALQDGFTFGQSWNIKTQIDYLHVAAGTSVCKSDATADKIRHDLLPLTSDHALLATPIAGQQYAEVIVQFLLQQIPKRQANQAVDGAVYPPHHWMLLLPEHEIVNRGLHLALKALALRVLSLVQLDRQAHISGMKMYGTALKVFRDEIVERDSNAGDMIATALILASFELINLTAEGIQRWRSHVECVRPVMLYWARFASDDHFSRSLISCWGTQMVYSGLLSNQRQDRELQISKLSSNPPSYWALENSMLDQQRKLLFLSSSIRFGIPKYHAADGAVGRYSCHAKFTAELEDTCQTLETRYGLLGKIMTILPKTMVSPEAIGSETDLVQYRLGLQ